MSAETVSLEIKGPVALITLQRPPENFIDEQALEGIADSLERCDSTPSCRAIVLTSEGLHFCAGVDFSSRVSASPEAGANRTQAFYQHALRVFRARKPLIAAVRGAAIGGGLGLALAADLRVATASSRFAANFARLGFHHGFGLSVTLPLIVGHSAATRMLLTGARITGTAAHEIGLVDELTSEESLLEKAVSLALDVAASAPLAVESIRRTLRHSLVSQVEEAIAHEATEQSRLRKTKDFHEGIRAMKERRIPHFLGE